MNRFNYAAVVAALLLGSTFALAKPIAFSHGTTVMAEYGAGTMNEAQVFYAPKYFLSLGAGISRARKRHRSPAPRDHLRARQLPREALEHEGRAGQRVRVGRRGPGLRERDQRSRVHRQCRRAVRLRNAPRLRFAQDRLYASSAFSHRIDTLQLGLAPYKHDYDKLATWVVVQGRRYTGGIHDGTEWALLLRLFKGGGWIEAGVTDDGKLQAMAMVNF